MNAVESSHSEGPAYTRGERTGLYVADGMFFGAGVYGVSAHVLASFSEHGLSDPGVLLPNLAILGGLVVVWKLGLLKLKGRTRQKWNAVRQTGWAIAASILVIGFLHSIIGISPFVGAGWLRSDALIIAITIFWSGFAIREMIFMRGSNAEPD